MLRSHILMLVCLLAAICTSGCGGGAPSTTTTGQTVPDVSISFKPAPPASVPIIGTATFAAVVSNDPSHAGVDWFLNCNTTDCGSLSAPTVAGSGNSLHTASGIKVTYQPPATLVTNSQPVFITAFATADDTKNVLAQLTVVGFNGILKGTYVFQMNGGRFTDPNVGQPLPYALAGFLTADGNGNITAGEQVESNSRGTFTDTIISKGSSYTVGEDGRGIIVLTAVNQSNPTGDPNVGIQGVETFSVVMLSSSQALIAEVDQGSVTTTSFSSSGTLDLQTSVAPPSGAYAFVVDGMTVAIDPNSSNYDPVAFGGVFNIDNNACAGCISGAGSEADEEMGFINSDGSYNVLTVNSTTLSGTVTVPESKTPGKVNISLTAGFTPTTIQLTGYIVDSAHIKLVESDNTSGTGFGTTGGVAIATGSFNAAALNGKTYVYGVNAQYGTSPVVGFVSLAGFVTFGQSMLSGGFTDQTDFLTGSLIADTLTQTAYLSDASGRVSTSLNFTNNGPGPTLIFYLTEGGNSALVLSSNTLAPETTLGAGVAYLQQPVSFAFNGPYGLSANTGLGQAGIPSFTGNFSVANPQQSLSGTMLGTIDLAGNAGAAGLPLSGTFSQNANTDIRFTGSLNAASQVTLPVAFYVIDANRGLFTETDGAGTAIGYFATRTPVCTGCPALRQSSLRQVGAASGKNEPRSRPGRRD